MVIVSKLIKTIVHTNNGQSLDGSTQHDSQLIMKTVVSTYCFHVTYDSFQN